MGGDGSGVGPTHAAQVTQDWKGHQGNEGTHQDDDDAGPHQIEHIVLGQFHPALESDRQQDVDGQGLINAARDLEIGTQQTRSHAEHEEQHHGFKTHHPLLPRRRLSRRTPGAGYSSSSSSGSQPRSRALFMAHWYSSTWSARKSSGRRLGRLPYSSQRRFT